MALVVVDVSSYDAFKAAILGNGYDVDNIAGYQCVDIPKELTGSAGRPSPYWRSGPDGLAYEAWTDLDSRNYNVGNLFTPIYNKADIRRGDVVVLDKGRFSGDTTGHVALADSDWNSGTTSAVLLGQNQVNPNPTTGHITTLTSMSVAKFLGGFRFNAWHQPVPPTPTRGEHKFPWYLYTRRLNEKRGGLS